jgi:HK97 family phage major capsid protein
MNEEQLKQALQAELKEFKANLAGYAEKADMEKRYNELLEKVQALDNSELLAELKSAIESQGIEMGKLNNGKQVVKSIGDFLKETKSHEKLRNRQQSEFEVKVVGDVTTVNVVDATTQPVLSILGTQGELYQVNRSIQQSILDEVDMGTSDKATIVYVDEVNGEGSIATTAEGIAKSQIDVDYQEITVNAIKKTGLVKVTEEALDDIGYMTGEINRVLTEKLMIAESLDVLTDILSNATTFSLTDFDDTVEGADIIDAIVAATAQSELSGFAPTAIVLHPVDIAKFQLVKSANIPRISTEAGRMMVNGLKIIKTTQITKDNFVLGDFKKYRVRRYKNKLVMGWDADDFSKNKRTIIAESRYLKYISTNEKTSLIKGVFTTIKAALETP